MEIAAPETLASSVDAAARKSVEAYIMNERSLAKRSDAARQKKGEWVEE